MAENAQPIGHTAPGAVPARTNRRAVTGPLPPLCSVPRAGARRRFPSVRLGSGSGGGYGGCRRPCPSAGLSVTLCQPILLSAGQTGAAGWGVAEILGSVRLPMTTFGQPLNPEQVVIHLLR